MFSLIGSSGSLIRELWDSIDASLVVIVCICLVLWLVFLNTDWCSFFLKFRFLLSGIAWEGLKFEIVLGGVQNALLFNGIRSLLLIYLFVLVNFGDVCGFWDLIAAVSGGARKLRFGNWVRE